MAQGQRPRTSDKPAKISATSKQLDSQGPAEPFVYVTDAGDRLTFPDPTQMEWEEAEEFLEELNSATRSGPTLRKWLGDDDFQKLKADQLTFRQMTGLMARVQRYYQSQLGSPGEGSSSGS